ncbi:MAG TPA: hypothetical protein VL994_03040 [Steroidobacteraceae bacterium]|nr:hypothetical protein [Steroidobacteraceae bacterium]
MSARRWCLPALLLLAAGAAHAEPYLAVANGYKCGQCHVNPTGGGERTAFGEIFAQTVLPAKHLDTGTDLWTGALNRFISVGGDLRYDFEAQQVPKARTTNQFDLEQARVYLEATVVPDRLLVYVDEQVAPGGALNREAWGMYWSADHTWYLKGGQMYLPFGLRLEDQTAFVRQVTGINMTTPDQGVEVGWEKGDLDVQLAVSNGTAGGAPTGNGKQESLQLQYVTSRLRIGGAANFNGSSSQGNRDAFGIFGGLKTGPVAWLAEADIVNDHSLPSGPGGGSRRLATLIEGNWSPARGHNLKVTYEYQDPDREVPNDQQTRWSLVYELTPIQFLQLRFGARLNDGIPQLPTEHLKLYFVQLHGFF